MEFTNKLETEKTYKLLLEYSIPAIIGSLLVAFYNLIDSIYIGHGPNLGDHAIGGLGIVLPIMTLLTSLGSLVGTGAASRISLYLGMKQNESAEKIVGNSIFLILSLTFAAIFFIYLFLKQILIGIGATEETLPFAYEFMLYYLPANFCLNLSYTLCSVMRASGYPQKAMYTMLLGVIANILIAPLFIFILEWGMKGAALATLLATLISLTPVVLHFCNKNINLRFKLNTIFPNRKLLWDITSIGLSPFIMQVAGSIVIFFINNLLKIYGGSIAIEAYTIANRLTLIIILIIVGLTQGMQPIIGYNYGAGRSDRVISTTLQAIKAGIMIGLIGLLSALFFTNAIIEPFNPTQELAKEAVDALSIICLMLPLSGLQMVISNFFQSIGMPFKATSLSLTRQIIFLIPALYILSGLYGLEGIWISIPLADLLSSILALILFIYQIKKIKLKVANPITT